MIDFINKALGAAIGAAVAVILLAGLHSCSGMPALDQVFVDGATPQEIQGNVIEQDAKREKPCN